MGAWHAPAMSATGLAALLEAVFCSPFCRVACDVRVRLGSGVPVMEWNGPSRHHLLAVY